MYVNRAGQLRSLDAAGQTTGCAATENRLAATKRTTRSPIRSVAVPAEPAAAMPVVPVIRGAGPANAYDVNPRFRQFCELVGSTPNLSCKESADILGVTRQTIHSWKRRLRDNDPVGRRGRPNKFGPEPSLPVGVRVPAEFVALVAAANAGLTPKLLRAQVRIAVETAVLDLLREAHAPHSAKASEAANR